ncbi:hypothetical protein [Fodinibius halophilus]|uniref:Uncharacterized protein n=1 Tax=Fodinibius halophilus TaxID=1736908 RepID=A0A6M1T5E0_9BACT|nr:hypothetical protein [Fodinibius halophilus]NGP88475.1 hypothetical protein [Fodinibius halophilus]
MFSEEETGLTEENLHLLIEAFAIHELGNIPEQYAEYLTTLAENFAMGLVTNIWAPKKSG